MFPFLSSTGLHPEWPVAALDHVSRDVSREVQEALLALDEHAMSLELNTSLRCDTTPELAALARDAKAVGLLAGFRTARTYSEVRTKQQVAGFMRAENNSPNLRCIRGDKVETFAVCVAPGTVSHDKVTILINTKTQVT